MEGWSLVLAGWPWYACLALAAAIVWAALRLQAGEIGGLPAGRRRLLRLLRAATAALLVLPLLEPTLSWQGRREVAQRLAILIDRSASMAANDRQAPASYRIDEAIALGLLDAGLRPDAPRRAAAACRAAIEAKDAKAWRSAARSLVDLAAELVGHAGIAPRLVAAAAALRQAADGEAGKADTGGMLIRLRQLADEAVKLQEAADAALLAGTASGSPLRSAIDALDAMSRVERARRLAGKAVARLGGRVNAEWWWLDERLERSSAETKALPGTAGTDFAGPLADLARSWGKGESGGGVLLLSDGRQTAGGDPGAAARALAARGVNVHTVAIGDPGSPRDAVVAEFSGAPEIFRGEMLRLEARVRIVDEPERAWDLIFTRDGVEVERRPLRASGQWQVERLERPAEAVGTAIWRARLEAAAAIAPGIRPGGGLYQELWLGVPGSAVSAIDDVTRTGKAADLHGTLALAASEDRRENYAERWTGWVVAPQTGTYTFWISGDDNCELRLAQGDGPLTTIAAVPQWTDRQTWESFAAQRSAPLPLRAGEACRIEVLHKQATGEGHCAIAWQLPDGALERPIPAARLAPPEAMSLSGKPATTAEVPEASLANNQADCTVTVVDDPLRVLVLDQQPRWEMRYVASLLERDRRVQSEIRWASALRGRGKGSLLPATQAEVDAFDAIILGDLSPSDLDAAAQARLRDFVSHRGGFLAVVSGPRAMPSSYGLGAMADLLPVRIQPGVDAVAPRPASAVTLGPDGDEHAITAILADRSLNRRLWPLLPPLRWSVGGVRPKPGAQVLVQTEAREPLVVLSRHGAGRLFWVGSDELWRWRDRLGDRVHQVFWLQALRWGLAGRLRGRDPHLQVALETNEIELGGITELRVRQRPAGGPAPLIAIERLDAGGAAVAGSRREVASERVSDAEGTWVAALRGQGGEPLEEGRWRVLASAAEGLREERILSVRRRASLEGIELGADRAALDRIAAAGNGRSLGPEGVSALADQLASDLAPRSEETRRGWSLWDGWWLAAIIAALLAGEWILRRRSGLP